MPRNDDRLIVTRGKLILEDRLAIGKDLVIEHGLITEIVEQGKALQGAILDAQGNYVAPGFIDLHTHGSFGVDFTKATSAEIARLQQRLPETGVTAFLATVAGIARDAMGNVVEKLQKTREAQTAGAQLLGVHLEGPYLNPARRGMMPTDLLETFDSSQRDLLDHVKPPATMTLAPELEGAADLIGELNRRGIIASGGHSDVTFEQTVEAVKRGLRHITHLFNAMPPPHHRAPNIVTAALVLDELTVELIVDGYHIAPPVVALVNKAKGVDRIVLVTDASEAAGMPDGDYVLGDVSITVRDGIARTADGALAGSTLTLNRAVKNFMAFTGLEMPQAVRTVTLNPARVLGIQDRKGKLETGFDADLTIFDDDLTIAATVVAGTCVWKSPAASRT